MTHIDNYKDNGPICDICGQRCGEETVDVWIMNTIHDRDEPPIQPGLPGANIDVQDYLTIGNRCCGQTIRNMWAEFVKRVQDECGA